MTDNGQLWPERYAQAVGADWRVAVRLDGASRGSRAILQGQVADGLRARLGELADISVGNGSGLFVYAETEALAGEAAQMARDLADEHGLAPQITLDWWSAITSEWLSTADARSLPSLEREAAEHERQVAEDARRSEATGVPQWTVRVTLPSRHDAVRLAGWLRSVGIPAVRRRKSVLLGATDEDVARELARLATEQTRDASVNVERTVLLSVPVDWGLGFPGG